MIGFTLIWFINRQNRPDVALSYRIPKPLTIRAAQPKPLRLFKINKTPIMLTDWKLDIGDYLDIGHWSFRNKTLYSNKHCLSHVFCIGIQTKL